VLDRRALDLASDKLDPIDKETVFGSTGWR
jgi:hypothetical protein